MGSEDRSIFSENGTRASSTMESKVEEDPIQRETTESLLNEIKENRAKNFFARNISLITPGGIRSSVFTFFSGTLGAGVLSLPHVKIQIPTFSTKKFFKKHKSIKQALNFIERNGELINIRLLDTTALSQESDS